MAFQAAIIALGIASAQAASLTCGDVRDMYNEEGCCGQPAKEMTTLQEPQEAPTPSPCPYDFAKPDCSVAGPQSPRDVTENSPGQRQAPFSPLNERQRAKLRQTNVNFHLGAEHYSQGQYDQEPPGDSDVAAGWMCNTDGYNMDPYDFSYCSDVHVGGTYEVHHTFSSAGGFDDDGPALTDGFVQAANGRKLLNPMVVVQAQVFFIVNDETHLFDDMVHGWQEFIAEDDAVSYAGSTTGPSHTNEICSPYAVSWHVDRKCHPVSAVSFDKMCKDMLEYGMVDDLRPRGSRELVGEEFVVPFSEVRHGTM